MFGDRSASAKGLFFVFEGIDGSGKTTQVEMLDRALSAKGFDTLCTSEPTSGRWGRKIREIAERGRNGVTPDEELRCFIEDRREHVRKKIAPALKRGKIVLCDRYYHSTIAYQGALGIATDFIRRLNEDDNRFPVPDLVFYIDVPPETALERIAKARPGGANLGYERLDFLRKVKAIYDGLNFPGFCRINGAQPPAAVASEIYGIVSPLLP
ncbi:MAG: dTMP kinase [bacterium]